MLLQPLEYLLVKLTDSPGALGPQLVLDDEVEDGAGHLLPLVQAEDGQGGVDDDEGVLVGRERFVPHRVGVDDLAGLALPDVVGLEHDHVVLPATVQVAQARLLGVEADLVVVVHGISPGCSD